MANRADTDRPLVSERSPSYARAREERRHPSPTPNAHLVGQLIVATHTEQDLANAYVQVNAHPNVPETAPVLARHHRERAELLRALLDRLGADAGPESDVSGSLLRVEFADMSYDTSTEALEALFREAEATMLRIYAQLGTLAMPGWLRAEAGFMGVNRP